MIRMPLLPVPVGLVMLGLATGNAAWAQSTGLELLLAGNDYHRTDLPANPAGTWWVLHRPAAEMVLEALQVVVKPFQTCGDDEPEEQRGRAVSVPAARDPILLARRHPALRAGTVRTAFLDDGANGEAERVEAPWGDRAVIVRHVAEDPTGDQPGEYRIELSVGDRQFQLHSDQWHGDGHWRVRWIGDLNRDGWPDFLVDASYKYSVYTTRLYLSGETDGRLEVSEAATFTHSAC
jgi:hypothetical protein